MRDLQNDARKIISLFQSPHSNTPREYEPTYGRINSSTIERKMLQGYLAPRRRTLQAILGARLDMRRAARGPVNPPFGHCGDNSTEPNYSLDERRNSAAAKQRHASAEKCRIFCHQDALLLWFAASAWKIERLTLSM